MKTISTDFKAFTEWDNNPFILFSNNGKILYLNSSAEIFFGYVSKKEIYDLAVSYAPHSFGYKTTTLSLNYDLLSFYALTVGYKNEDEISIRLYHNPCTNQFESISSNTERSGLRKTDINILLEANISLFKISNRAKILLLTDQELPMFDIDQNAFSKLLKNILEVFASSDTIEISMKLLIGRYLLVSDKKERIVQLDIQGDKKRPYQDNLISTLASQNMIKVIYAKDSIKLEIPALSSK